jgi:hypothetical protein
MAKETYSDPNFDWLDMLQPTGLVVGKNLLRTLGLVPDRQTQVETTQLAQLLDPDTDRAALSDPWAFATTILGWETRLVADAPGGEPLSEDLAVRLPEHDTTLAPTWAVRELGAGDRPFQLLVSVEKGVDLDKRGALGGWEATPHQRFERLLRETGVHAGLIIADRELRLVYAPKGETSGWLSFPIREMATVAGRPMLGGLKLLLDKTRLFTDAPDRRLPALLVRSRVEQAAVSTALAEQVLGALHELLRGLDAADPDEIRALAAHSPEHVYEGLLTVLMRFVFILYAEDRDLLPSLTDAHARDVYDRSYSLRGLYGKLVEDAALNPDTMDERRGGWGRMLALFRLIHAGHSSHFVQARGGKLFDPDVFLFLEGRAEKSDPPRVLNVSDGCILRILDGLMTIKGERGAGRERLSYRTLDVEQIGSVYETVMGFKADEAKERMLAIKAGKNNKTPVFVPLESLLAQKGKERVKFLKEEADRALTAAQAKSVEAAKTIEDLAAALDAIVDERASPRKQISQAGAPILQPTDERRRTGSHYTPRSLTEPIVRHALEPAFERLGPDATPEQILDLKVCDPAMGSGAFLVEACRALASRLVQAWARWPGTRPVIPADEDEELHARRLVAQRCLYGVDKNPLATDLAKLSLWLATLARDHEFTFLDHALKSGDSLVGLTQKQIAAANWDESKPGLPLFRSLVADRVKEAMKGRAEIQQAPDDVARVIQEARHRSLDSRLDPIRTIGDATIAAFFSADKPKAREHARAEVESILSGRMDEEAWERLRVATTPLSAGDHPLAPFHWEIEFPEVFVRENGGFDAFVGNPPFLGGTRISTALGVSYQTWIKFAFEKSGNRMDLVAYFFRQAFNLLRMGGAFGLIGTNTISQGDTRTGGLGWIARNNGALFAAQRRKRWPGEAAVMISIVHGVKGVRPTKCRLDGRAVEQITAFLVEKGNSDEPLALSANLGLTHSGVKTYGQGFLFADDDAKANSLEDLERLLQTNPKNGERIKAYLGGEELNEDPAHRACRYAIDFTGLTESQARQWPDLFKILQAKIPLERRGAPAAVRASPFWRYWNARLELRAWFHAHRRFLARSETSKHHALTFLSTSVLPSQKLVCFCFDGDDAFAVIQSRAHEIWTLFFGPTLEDRPVYSQSDCFETFPFPIGAEVCGALRSMGQAYYDHRAALMIARDEGMTKTYNRFHDRKERGEDIVRLRELHADMDRAVLAAYGWDDLAARAAPIFLDESNEDDHAYQGRLFWPSDFRDEVLARLLALNAERHADEVRRGVAPGMKGKREDESEDEEEEFA